MRRISSLIAVVVVSMPAAALATTYQVGPNKPYRELKDVEAILHAGDVVEVDGDTQYSGDIHIRPGSSGTASNPITIRGITVNGHRPVIHGGASYGIVLHGNYTVFENFEVTASQGACIINKANGLTLRNLYVHDCPGQGILGMDVDAGDQTIEFSEITRCGNGIYDHQIYLANDQTLYPNARMRIQHSWIHDGNGGNNLKSRASRNEIYNNWIESPYYHLLDLIGADGQDPGLAREDSDVVGNVLIQTSQYTIARIGGDGTGATAGRYRFAYNTIVTSPSQSTLFRLIDDIESVAFHDNAFVAPNGGSPTFVDSSEAAWTTGSAKLAGERNFVQQGLNAPSFFIGSVSAHDGGFVDPGNWNLMPNASSPLVDAGSMGSGPSGYEIPNPLTVPEFVPPMRTVSQVPILRSTGGAAPDIGAFEVSSGGGGGGGGGGSGGSDGSGGAGAGDPGSGGGGAGDPGSGGAGAGDPGSGGSDSSTTSGAGAGEPISEGGNGDGGTAGVGAGVSVGDDDDSDDGGGLDDAGSGDDGGASTGGGCAVEGSGTSGALGLVALALAAAFSRSRRRATNR